MRAATIINNSNNSYTVVQCVQSPPPARSDVVKRANIRCPEKNESYQKKKGGQAGVRVEGTQHTTQYLTLTSP